MQQELNGMFDEVGGDLGGQGEPINRRQMDGSQGTFEAMIRRTNGEIDGIRRQNERKEKDRRFEEELLRQKRYENIQNEAQAAARKLAELEMRWSEYKEMEECQELNQSLVEHKKMFAELVANKNGLISSLHKHIATKNEEYMTEMDVMKDDIDVLTKKIRTQFRELRDLVGSELKIVEDDLNRQRSERLGKMQEEITDKFNNLRKVERDSTEQRKIKEGEEIQKIEELRINFDKKFLDLKINTEIEIQNCEKCHEDMKALYQLNSEKLSYNYKVLVEKNSENSKLKQDLRTKDAEYQDQYKQKSTLYKQRYTTLINYNKTLTKQYTSISRQYKDLHKKYQHFELTDKARYKEIKDMNEAEIQKMKEKIKNCDRIIHQHQLGVVWENFTDQDLLNEEFEGEDEPIELQEEENNEEEQEDGENEDKQDNGIIPEIELNAIINLLLTELDFLLDDKVSNEIEKEGESQQLLVKMNVLRKVLAVKDESEMFRLLMEVYTKARKRERDDGKTAREGASKKSHSVIEDPNADPNLVDRNIEIDQYNAREFDENESQEEDFNQNEAGLAGQAGAENEGEEEQELDVTAIERKYDTNKIVGILSKFIDDKGKHVVMNSADHQAKKMQKKKEKVKDLIEQRKYRAKMSKALPDERLKMWKVLDKISSQYYRLLQERQRDIEETTQLHTQNDELKNLLNQYMKVHHNLLIPPTNMLSVNYLE